MKNKFKALLSMLAVFSVLSVSAACSIPGLSSSDSNSSSVEAPADSSVKETYTVTFVDYDGTVLSSETYEEGATVTPPAAPSREGNHIHTYKFVGWDKEVSAVTGNETYKAVYEVGFVEYVVTFLDDEGNEISKTTYHYGDTITIPSAEKPDGEYIYTFTGWDSEVDKTVSGDATYTATYTKELAQYTVTFMVGDEVVGTDTYTSEDKDITVPEIPAKAHYTASWEDYTLTSGDITVNAVYTPVTYTITFVDGEETVATVDFNIEDTEKSAPEIPEKLGYTGAWGEYDFSKLEDQTVALTYTANTYKIIYDANGGSLNVAEEQDVEFGSKIELPVPTAAKMYQEFLGWCDQNGNSVESGVWNIADNVTLIASYSNKVTFDNATEIPSYMKAADTTESLSIVEMNGGKVLRMKNGDSTNAPALIVTLEFLASFFEDKNVAYVAFDAKSELGNYNNFRRVTKRSNGTFAADCYAADLVVNNVPVSGIRNDAFKTFYFSRADYQSWIDNNVTEQRIIASGGIQGGDSFYVDNIRPVTADEFVRSCYSFEGDGVRINDAGRTLLFYTAKSAADWSFNMQVGEGQAFTNVGYTNDNVTDGIRALKFTKPAGNLAVNFNSAKQAYGDIVTKTGYWAIDIYVPVGAGARISTGSVDLGNSVIPGATPVEGAWTTIYLSGSKNSLTIGDDNGGTYYVDNIRSITAEEYQAAQYSFETGTVGLRLNLLGDATTNVGAAYIYNKGDDYNKVKASLVIAEGNGEKDGNAVSNVRFANEVVHGGTYSIAFDKGVGYAYMTRHVESQAKVDFDGGFTFWIYSTTKIDGVNTSNLVNGVNNKLNGGEGIVIEANTWTQITIHAEEIGDGRFLILQGNWEGTIYVDDFQPLN